MQTKPWNPPPRYIFRRFNLTRQVKRLSGIETFLDIGCGAGDLDCTLVERFGWRGTGMDFSKSAIETAEQLKQARGLKKQPQFKLVGEHIPPKTAKADLVICLEVLEHVKDDSGLLERLVALSNKYLVVSVPAKKKLFSHSDKMAGHYRRYEKAELLDLLAGQDLEVRYFAAYGYPFTNLLRLVRELLAKRSNAKISSLKEEQSQKSGVDLMKVNRFFSLPLSTLLYPGYLISLLFNRFDLAEGYLVVCEKSK